jgi:hypothetical protein
MATRCREESGDVRFGGRRGRGRGGEGEGEGEGERKRERKRERERERERVGSRYCLICCLGAKWKLQQSLNVSVVCECHKNSRTLSWPHSWTHS